MARRHWLIKTDPETFSVDDLERAPLRTTRWDGVRNYQARNLLRDEIGDSDPALFYHSRLAAPAVVALVEFVGAAYPDPTQFDRRAPGFDPQSRRDEPRWYARDVRFVRRLARPVELSRMRETPGLAGMVLLRKGSRLSVQPVTAAEWKTVLRLGAAAR